MIHFIRHAQSSFNLHADINLPKKLGQEFSKAHPQFVALKFDPKYIDSGLTQQGKQQCLNARPQAHALQTQLVIVSPMRRALQTCQLIFDGHPSKPRIVVDSGVREIFSSACDIGSRLPDSIRTGEFPGFDFQLIQNPEFWYLQTIKNKQLRQQLMSQLHKRATQQNIILPKSTSSSPLPEPQSKKLQRIAEQIFLNHLSSHFGKINIHSFSNFQSQRQRLKQLGKQYKNIVIVTHHDNIVTLTKRKTKNCQILSIKLEDL